MCRCVMTATLVAAAALAAWQTPTNFGTTINTSAGEYWPSIAQDGTYILFVSDRAGGQGGTDIWRTTYSGGSWQTPVNMGTNVNSSSNDSLPDLCYGESRLYYVSNCAGGQGNYDIWWCTITNGVAGPKTNLGPTVNTTGMEC